MHSPLRIILHQDSLIPTDDESSKSSFHPERLLLQDRFPRTHEMTVNHATLPQLPDPRAETNAVENEFAASSRTQSVVAPDLTVSDSAVR